MSYLQVEALGAAPEFWDAGQVYPRTARFKDMSPEIEVELAAFSVTILSTAPDSEELPAISRS